MITDEEIRDALEHLAQHAPDPNRVRLQFAVRDRVRRQRRALTLVGGAVAAGVAVGAPLVLLRDRHSAAPSGSLGPSAEPSPSPLIVNDRIPMRYRPTWLPDGMVEAKRGVGATTAGEDPDQQTRIWRNETNNKQLVILQMGGPDSYDVTGLPRITVHGVPGWVDERPGRPGVGVVWQAEPGVLMSVIVDGFAPESTTVPLQVANSVTRDGNSILELPVALGWLPDGFGRTGVRSVAATPHGWRTDVAADNGKQPSDRVSVTLGTAADVLLAAPDGVTTGPVSVRGVTGTFNDPHSLLVPFAGGLGLRVMGNASQSDLVRVADTLRIGPVPDLSWLGTR